jgi:hypothetical protein
MLGVLIPSWGVASLSKLSGGMVMIGALTQSPGFWNSCRFALLAWYSLALNLALSRQSLHACVVVTLLLLGVHLLEVPYAIWVLRPRSVDRPYLALMTLVFGFLWWFPLRRGIISP